MSTLYQGVKDTLMDFDAWQAMKDTVKRDRVWSLSVMCDLVPGAEDKLPALSSVSWAFDGQRSESDLDFPLNFSDNLTRAESDAKHSDIRQWLLS